DARPEHFPKSVCPPQIPLANSGLPSITPTNFPNPSKQTLYVPNCANGPPNSSPAVRTAPNLSLPNQASTMSAYPTAQHKLGAHAPPNVNNNPLPNHGNQGVYMVTLDEEYDMRGTIVPVGNTEVVVTTSPVAPFITVQLREPLTIYTYQPRSVVTTAIAQKSDYNSQAVPWDYQAEAKAKMINTATAHGMTRSGRFYVQITSANQHQGENKAKRGMFLTLKLQNFGRRCRSRITKLRSN
ncbi:hypothetical protein HAX54_031827, partial [Datura stramonium]|nr:hypothetical protein [Datura stramonium]